MPIPALVGSALVGGGAGLLNTAVNAIVGNSNLKRQLKANKELAKYQNDLNIQNWKMQNDYNLPKNQMQRFADAGLNPNLIYGQSNTAGDVGNVNVGSVDASLPLQDSVMNAVNLAMGLRQMHADIKQKNAQTDNVKAQTDWTNEKIITEQLEQMLKRKDGLIKDAQKTGLYRDNFLKKLEIDNWSDKWNLTKQNMQYNNLLLYWNRQKILNDMAFGWTKFNSDNQQWKKDFKLRNDIFQHQKDVDDIRFAGDAYRKKYFYDRGFDYTNSGTLSPLINAISRGVADFTDWISRIKFPSLW